METDTYVLLALLGVEVTLKFGVIAVHQPLLLWVLRAFTALYAIGVVLRWRAKLRLRPVSFLPTNRALVTGGSSGIGLAIAEELARRGWNLVLVARSAETLKREASRLASKHGVSVASIAEDLGQPGAAARVFQRFEQDQQFAGASVELLVNNAGHGVTEAFAEQKQGDLAAHCSSMQTNMVALSELTQLFLPGMLQRKRGRVMLLSSITAFFPNPYAAVYGATKAFIRSFGRSLEYELRGTGVGVTTVYPGSTWSKFGARSGSQHSAVFRLNPFVMQPEAVARSAVDAMLRGDAEVTSSLPNQLACWCLGTLLPSEIALFALGLAWKPQRPARKATLRAGAGDEKQQGKSE